MAFLDSMGISASALSAERYRMDVIAENMANLNTTRGANGEPYRRKTVVFAERQGSTFSALFRDRMSGVRGTSGMGGVRVVDTVEDQSEFKLDYNPSHPDADAQGYVRLPNVDVVQEMLDMMASYRAYEANVTAINTFKDMAMKTLEIGK
ncbi:MAG: flagellar basal body rod protein FlgC [Oscillospiraceae bacterium]|jgi:flagellar basal-body rod protein FlgC|nr:flagellar basal body rod protein FlgC [Oscillospiraceae bacterium]